MRRITRAVPAVVGVLALTGVLGACDDTADSGKSGKSKSGGSGSASAEDKTEFRMGETSPVQANDGAKVKGKWTVTPTKAETGTMKDMDNSGLDRKGEEAKIPVYVWSTIQHKGGSPLTLRDMKSDTIAKTDKGTRTRELVVIMGDAKWPDCPAPDAEKKLKPGEQAKICQAYLVPEGQKIAAVELHQGYNSAPLSWPVK